MNFSEIISLVITIIGVFSFATIITILYKNYATSQIAETRSGKLDIELIDEVIYEKKEEVKKRKKITGIVKTVIFYLILCVIIPVFVLSLINRFVKKPLMLFDHTMMVVASGSMSEKNKDNEYLVSQNLNNQFLTNDIITLEKVKDVNDLKLYDVVAYVNDEGINIIHRIIGINYENDEITFVTRGDANNVDDRYHPKFDDIIGRYNDKKIKGLGIIIRFLQSYAGLITMLSLVYCLIMIDRITAKMLNAKKERILKLSEVIDYQDETHPKNFKAEYLETIYYQGYAYLFNEEGFVAKNKIVDGPYLEKPQEVLVKEIVDKKTSAKTSEEIILNEEAVKGEQSQK